MHKVSRNAGIIQWKFYDKTILVYLIILGEKLNSLVNVNIFLLLLSIRERAASNFISHFGFAMCSRYFRHSVVDDVLVSCHVTVSCAIFYINATCIVNSHKRVKGMHLRNKYFQMNMSLKTLLKRDKIIRIYVC